MDKFRVNLKNKMDKYIKLNGISYEYFSRADGFKSLSSVRRNGNTRFKTLFETSKFLGIDVRNFLMFDNNTYIFENSFANFEEFFIFLANKLKFVRLNKKLSIKDVVNNFKKEVNFTTIYKFEKCKICISLDKFYAYLDALDITSDKFFLIDEKYQIIGNQTKNEISIDDFNDRIYELEQVRGTSIGGNIAVAPNTFPTLQGFFKICKSLKVSPRDFFDFNKKKFGDDFEIIDISNLSNFIKQKLEMNGVRVQRYIKLDSIFLFCNERNILIIDFFDVLDFDDESFQSHEFSL